jgi:hypothetical protein
VREGLRVRELANDEGNRLLRIVRRCSGSVVTWRRAQMVLLSALLHLARRCRRRIAKWSRFPSRRLSEVLKAINPGIANGVQGLWWRTPV